MSKSWKRILATMMLAAMLLTLGLGGTVVAEGRTDLNVLISDSFSTLDPHGWSMDSDFRICYQVYEPLLAVDDETNEHPMLATSYTVSEDGTAYTFTLAENVAFSNGDIMTASDVKYSIERAKNGPYISGFIPTVESVEADDAAGTVTVHLTAPTPGLIEGMSQILIVNEAFVEANKDANGQLGYNACGTGPYMLDSYIADSSVTLTANPNYRRGEAPIKTLRFLLITDPNTAATAFQAGEIDIARLHSASWETIKASGANTAELPANHVTYLIFNTEQAPFDNPLVRQAVACAVNREDITLMAMDGLAAPTYTVVSPYMVGYAEIEPQYTYDPDRARALLAEAGYPDGLDVGDIQTLSGSYLESAVQVVQQQLAEVGITSNVTGLEANTLITNLMGGMFTIGDMGQSNTFDMSWLDTYYSTSNIDSMNMARYNNPEVDEKLVQAGICMDPAERTALYKEILEIVDADCAYVPLFNQVRCTAWANGLNFIPQVRTNESYYDCSWE